MEVDEKGHTNRDKRKENEREEKMEKELYCEFIRINLDEKHFDICVEIGRIHNHVIKSTKESTKKSLIDKIPKRILEFEF